MRTTVSLSDDVHDQLVSLARDRGQSLSRTVDDLLRRVVTGEPLAYRVVPDPETGFVSLTFGREVTAEDVRALDDE